MADIARLAGVSVASVSRALSGSSEVGEATRQRILELAKSLNYSVNQSAKNLRMGQNHTIEVLAPLLPDDSQRLTDPFLWELIGGIAEALTGQGYRMLLSRIDVANLNVAESFESGLAMGVILTGQWLPHDQLNELAMRNIPLAVWGAEQPRQMYCTVGTDNRLGGQLAAGHLLNRGARHIAFLGDTSTPEIAQRYAGYQAAHVAAGLTADPALLVRATFNPHAIEAALAQMLDADRGVDGIVATSDVAAMAALRALQAKGLRVPDDVAVVGYDDIAAAAWVTPPLTTIRQPLREAGHALVHAVAAQVRGEMPNSSLLPTELIKRESA